MRTRVREATPEDVPGIHDLIRQLADYDRESDLFTASVADLEEAMFGDDAILHALVAEGEDGLAGVATWYLRYGTWEGGRCGSRTSSSRRRRRDATSAVS
ncbi:MAG: hypothetical protein GX356_10085 [Corynebacterium pollutisoli]|uniref:N-acetyltransferase domain-containing protein n=1 Tax=Corynebacterium pollutisoli TaxID=1610489 RepID=A0A7X8MXB7_9CORY|nr:hypothetical protein [Corynebacterium pollutisoli]